ncbi:MULTISPECIES: virB8 family protein [unclassified Mesorhizobium]|uniref:virB8 family protein n=1 Tax=unclassified Mesorhizobium TaxID=325217 RepID=UPI000FD3501A|nr:MULTISPECIES: type IV secretion system protein [unclassified Mesorhizobium]RUU73550.1 type VI secretion protein [Mesorhizobium sp. M7A.F.Ca.MR.362.00.0.0]RWN86376.1 MAG: type VI secretion protein [Mesorhizobium sp.]RWO95399.1 MAG: type VI secretion protein [Mesorhizobium sp.]TIM52735.1 MAG: type VI secretion protein [Mesorhizobium sp.]
MQASIPAETGQLVDQHYYRAGATWEDDTHRSLRRSRTLAWLVSGAASVVAGLSLLTLVLILPLKQFEPYVIEVDKTTGYLEVARALKPGDLSQNEAVTAANLVRYIRAREIYDAREIKQNYDLAQLYSTGTAARDLTWAYTPSNAQSLDKVYGRNVTISVDVKSVSLLNNTTASVRFSTTTRRENSSMTDNWVAVVKFRYTTTPIKNEWRFDNPLGFQVIEYRRDQESAPTAGSAQ